jgi:hypothetical protein
MSSMAWARMILSPTMLHSVSSVAPCCRVAWHCSGARRVVHSAVAALLVRTSCRPMMTLMSSALETCVRALETCVPSCTGRTARPFFMLETRGPQGAAGYVAALEPTSTGRRGPKP